MHLCSDPLFTGSPDTATVILNDLSHNGQTDTASALGRISGRVGAVEPVKDIWQIFGCNSFSIVLDLHLDEIPVILDADIDNTFFLVQIFHRIADDIVDHTLHLLCIGNDHYVFIYVVKISQFNTNKIPYTFSKINVSQYFRDCVEEVGLDMEARGIELGYFNYVDEDVVVIADAEQMKRVINNIIGNSVKYLDKKKGIINIRIKDDGDFIQVEIEDNGKGIAAKDLPNIFDRFYRTDSSRNSSQGGSGIGLSIVRKIIEDHGGRIWATSKEGIGTEVHFVLRKYQEVIQE